jgi:hypothetical protein
MENWVFLFLGLLLTMIYDFAKPWIKSYFEKSSLSIRERRKYTLIKRYKLIGFELNSTSLGWSCLKVGL